MKEFNKMLYKDGQGSLPTSTTEIPFNNLMVAGKKYDSGKLRTDLIDPTALEGMAAVLTFGANKYGDRNWENGIKWSRVFGALLRHAWAMWKGEDLDPETNLPHIDHVAVNVMFLQRFFRTHRMGWDDRPTSQITATQWTVTTGVGVTSPSNSGAQPVVASYQDKKAEEWNSSTPALYAGPGEGEQCESVTTPNVKPSQVWCSECNCYHSNTNY